MQQSHGQQYAEPASVAGDVAVATTAAAHLVGGSMLWPCSCTKGTPERCSLGQQQVAGCKASNVQDVPVHKSTGLLRVVGLCCYVLECILVTLCCLALACWGCAHGFCCSSGRAASVGTAAAASAGWQYSDNTHSSHIQLEVTHRNMSHPLV